jgi:hypothetical protein
MARRKGDGKRVVQDTEATGKFTSPKDAEWKELELKLGHSLPWHARAQIGAICLIFSATGSDEAASAPVKKIVQKLDDWRHRTSGISRQIWSRDNTPKPATLSREWVERTYFDIQKVKRIAPEYHLLFLAHAMDAALAACEWVIQELKSPIYEGRWLGELWPWWAALLIHILQDHGIPTTASSATDKQTTDSNLVQFVLGLQEYLPAECRRYKTSGSMVKGIQKARTLIEPNMHISLIALLGIALGGLQIVKTQTGTKFKRTQKFWSAYQQLGFFYPAAQFSGERSEDKMEKESPK